MKLCPLDEWWLLAAHYLAITASLNWHLEPNWCGVQLDTNTSVLKWRKFDCRLASSWISIYTHTEWVRNVCASWHRTCVGHVPTCLISVLCLSKLDHSYLTSLLVSRGRCLSSPHSSQTHHRSFKVSAKCLLFCCVFLFFFPFSAELRQRKCCRSPRKPILAVTGRLVFGSEWAGWGEHCDSNTAGTKARVLPMHVHPKFNSWQPWPARAWWCCVLESTSYKGNGMC